MKYWLLTSEFPPFFGGGISTYCSFTASMLTEHGYEVTVIVNDSSITDIKEELTDNYRIIRFNPSRSGSSAFLGHVTNLSYEFALVVKQYVEQEGQPDIIETQDYLGIGYYLLQFKKLQYDWCKDVPVLVTMHSPAFLYLEYNHVPLYKYPNFWIGEMERFCLNAADAVISPSKFLIAEVNNRFQIENDLLSVVSNPFSFSSQENNICLSLQGEDIVFFGKLSAQKGIFKLLQYFKNLWDDGFSESLYLIGGQDIVYHPENKTMGDLIRKRYGFYLQKSLLQLENKIAPTQIKTRLQKAKVVIIPSTVDNLPYVVMEMMSLGLVVLVSRQGGQAEMVEDGISGFIFNHSESETFYSKLKQILNLTQEERIAIGENARNRIRAVYDPNKIYLQKVVVLTQLLSKKKENESFPFIRETRNPEILPLISAENTELLSVVIPYYNLGKYLAETIKSVKASDYLAKEIIIINDGTDEEESINQLITFRQDPDIKIVDCKNQGLGTARNIGATIAKGKYLAFVDADDLVTPDYFSKAIKVLKHYRNVHFVGAWTQYFEGSKNIWPTFNPEPPIILYHNTINSSSLVYKRESFLHSGKNDTAMPFSGLEDYESVISMVSKGFRGVTLPEPLFHYRVRKDSMIRGVSKTKKLILQDYISQRHKLFYAKFASESFSLLNANGPGIFLDNPTLDFDLSDKIPFNGRFSRKVISVIKRNKLAKYMAYRAYKLLNK